jgi:DNA-binding response OmpR family regulator
MRILLIEDDEAVARFVQKGLREEGHNVTLCGDGVEAQMALVTESWDVVILDIMLPDRSGFEVLRRARQAGLQTPVLVLSARDATEDRVRGLNLGADDYLVKPFAFEEFLARLHALARRPPQLDETVLRVGPLTLDRVGREAVCRGEALRLSPTEFALLELLVRNAGRTVPKTQILQAVWGDDWDRGTNIVEVYVNYLRKKLRAKGVSDLVETVRGVGYRVVDRT